MFTQGVRNLLQSAALVAGMVGMLLALGWLFAGVFGMVWALAVGIIPLVVSIRVYPTLILKMYGAKPLTAADSPQMHAIVNEMARRAGLAEPPSIHYIPSAIPLIFSVGKGKNSAIAIADGVLRLLTLREIVGVVGHEVSHIRNSDTWVMSFADVVTRVTRMISLLGQLLVIVNLPLYILGEHSMPWVPLLLMLLAPTLSALLQLSLSRTREFEADLWGARISGDPAGLASALAKLEISQQRAAEKTLPGMRKVEPSLLRTHPITDERIRRLRDIEHEMYPGLETIVCPDDGGPCLPPHLEEITRQPRRHLSGLWH
ncbi:MAG: peptidase M48 [Desulfuromonadales bacterium]|nr:MAG: peptidase M48 [Desulfuromonadales bacterium]